MDSRVLIIGKFDAPVCCWLRTLRYETAHEDDVSLRSPTKDSLVNRNRASSVRDSVLYQYLLDLACRSGIVVPRRSVLRGGDNDMTKWLQSLCPCLRSDSREEDGNLTLVTSVNSIPSAVLGDASTCPTNDFQSPLFAATIEELGVTVTELFTFPEPEIETIEPEIELDQPDIELDQPEIEPEVEKAAVPLPAKRPSRRVDSILPPLSLRRISEVSCELTADLKFAQINPIRFPSISFDEISLFDVPSCFVALIGHRVRRRSLSPERSHGTSSPVFAWPTQRRSWPVAVQLIEKDVVHIRCHSQSGESQTSPVLACAEISQTFAQSDAVVWRTSSTRLLRSCSIACAAQV